MNKHHFETNNRGNIIAIILFAICCALTVALSITYATEELNYNTHLKRLHTDIESAIAVKPSEQELQENEKLNSIYSELDTLRLLIETECIE